MVRDDEVVHRAWDTVGAQQMVGFILPPPFTPAAFIRREEAERRKDRLEMTQGSVGAPSAGQ